MAEQTKQLKTYKELREFIRETLPKYFHSLIFIYEWNYYDYKLDIHTGEVIYESVSTLSDGKADKEIGKIVREELKAYVKNNEQRNK